MENLEDNQYNGRVDIMENKEDTAKLFSMYDKMPVNEPACFRNATKGIYNESLLSRTFFCAGNMQIIQNGIKAGVYKKSNEQFIVPNQNTDTLKIIMRSIFMQHAIHSSNAITRQVEELNALVLEYAVPQVYSAMISHNKYLKDASTLVQPMELPKLSYTSKQLPRLNYGFSKEDGGKIVKYHE